MSILKDKKILMFAPKFFNYENIMKEEMEKQGAIVHLYDERNNPTLLEKVILRIKPVLMKRKINTFYSNVCKNEKDFDPDFVFFVSPETVNSVSIKNMRKIFSHAKFILYMYDSLENKNAKHIYRYFDKCLSFDSNDCEKYGFVFRPLFFSISRTDKSITEFTYDLGFIGTIHSDRARILSKIAKICEIQGLKYFYYLYVPSKVMLFIREMIDRNVRKLKEYIHVQPLDKRNVAEILSKTNYIIDINHPKQVGLTMRTIEMLGLKRKMITTNEYIKKYDFYNPKNQIVINREKIQIEALQLSEDDYCVDSEIYMKYSLEYWTKEVFSF